jgi:hypothetical protein
MRALVIGGAMLAIAPRPALAVVDGGTADRRHVTPTTRIGE